MSGIIVICTTNRGRSPLAEAMLRRRLSEIGIDSIGVESAGMCVFELGRVGAGVNPLVAEVARRRGYDLSGHRARPFDAERFDDYDLIIVMEDWQAFALHQVFQPDPGKVFTLRQLAGKDGDPNTPDVAGVPQEAIESYFAEADDCLGAAMERGPLADLVARVKTSAAAVRKSIDAARD